VLPLATDTDSSDCEGLCGKGTWTEFKMPGGSKQGVEASVEENLVRVRTHGRRGNSLRRAHEARFDSVLKNLLFEGT